MSPKQQICFTSYSDSNVTLLCFNFSFKAGSTCKIYKYKFAFKILFFKRNLNLKLSIGTCNPSSPLNICRLFRYWYDKYSARTGLKRDKSINFHIKPEAHLQLDPHLHDIRCFHLKLFRWTVLK